MSIMGFAFAVGILIWWAERRDIASTRKPSPCHYCWCAGEMQMAHWNGKRWVHANGGAFLTRLDSIVGSPPHNALPRHEEDEISTPTFTPFEEMGLDLWTPS
jgi:hypothetical protein